MSEATSHAAATSLGHLHASTAATEFSELWKNVSKLTHGKSPANKPAPTQHASPLRPSLQSPKQRGRFPGVSNADSPGDTEPSQDIVWDSTSPSHSNTGVKCIKVEISDLVNRIAPKDVKSPKSPLLQWIGDNAVPYTPDIPKHKHKKRSSRQNSVEDLMKLARQFDENMQQNKETSETLNIINNNINKCANPADPKEKVQLALSSDSREAELRALFDSSTQKISGPLSQATSSGNLQGAPPLPVMPLSQKASETSTCDDFDDDWENELLNDSLLMALTENPEQHIVKTNMQSNTKCISENKSSVNANHVPTVSKVHTKPSYSALQALCPKPKTTNRSTFKLGPDPFIQLPTEPPESKFTALKSPCSTEQKSIDDDFSDGLWDDGDDALLYKACDSVERISNSQLQKVNQPESQDKCDPSKPHKVTAPLPIIATNISANKQSGAFVCSNSLPATRSTALNLQGWNIPMHGSSVTPQISQSVPGNHRSMGLSRQFNHDLSSGKPPQKSSPTAFKRNVSDSAVICNKVFVTSEMTGKCSAAEIERKKQDALARRRQRMQNSEKT